MKHVRRLLGATGGLARFLETTTKHHEGQPPRDAWQEFRLTDKGKAYRELVKELAVRQHGLCIYCERRLTDDTGEFVKRPINGKTVDVRSVEHVQPKSSSVQNVLDWRNLALDCMGNSAGGDDSCEKNPQVTCGQRKRDRELPRGCDPRDFPDVASPMTHVGLDGALIANKPSCEAADICGEDLQRTIDNLLNLNNESLKLARSYVGNEVRKNIHDLKEWCLTEGASAEDMAEAICRLAGNRLQPDSVGHLCSFWTAERSAFGEFAEMWIAKNQHLFA